MLNRYLNTIFEPEKGMLPCWSFCRFSCKTLGISLPDSVWQMTRFEKCSLHSIVLFQFEGNIWHTALIWPDCLHILHAIERPSGVYVIKSRLDKRILKYVKGYYVC